MPALAINVDVSMNFVGKLLTAVLVLCQVCITRSVTIRTENVQSRPISFHASDPGGSLRGRSGPTHAVSLISLDQVPGPKPAWVEYGEPEFTTFNNVTTACQACMEFFPVKEDGNRFHQMLYEDPESGGVWERSCRAGLCDFRDPQTDPVGGIIGKGVGPDGKPDGKTCITRDPVQWYTDCDPILRESTHTLLDATRYCSYKEQIFIPPPKGAVSRFGGEKPVAWARIGATQAGGKREQCMATIEKEGAALWDSMSFCDADLPALSGCCETVFNALSCVAETSAKTHMGIFDHLSDEASQMLDSFSKYCVPLCQNTKEEFCAKFPGSDPCVNPNDCTDCTVKGGLWCPKLKSCHCPSKTPPCLAPPVTAPMQCFGDSKEAGLHAPPAPRVDEGAGDGLAGDGDKSLCKYKEFAQKWKRRK